MVEQLQFNLAKNESFLSSEFTVRVDYINSMVDHMMTSYLPGNNGVLNYEPMKF